MCSCAIISERRKHIFANDSSLQKVMLKYGVHSRLSTAYLTPEQVGRMSPGFLKSLVAICPNDRRELHNPQLHLGIPIS
ncbi:hypothetical protein Tco_0033172 [Tanacetum coccineum]